MVAPPSSELATPQASQFMPDLVVNSLGVAQYISASYWMRVGMDRITEAATGEPWNPWSWFAEQAAGDWEEVSRAGDALAKLAEFNAVFASAVRSGTDSTIPYGWDGNAAASAQEYFTDLNREIDDHVAQLAELGSQLDQMAAGIFLSIQTITNLLDSLLDSIITIAIGLALTGATAKTVVGGVVFGAATIAKIVHAANIVRQILDAWNNTVTGTYAFSGVVMTYLAPISGTLEKFELSHSSYQHPAVTSR